jgi:transcriptional regulator with XRE-family HTH domain
MRRRKIFAIAVFESVQKASQGSFEAVSSRNYVSPIERGLRAATVEKLDQIAQAIGIPPLASLAFAYIPSYGRNSEISAFDLMLNDLARL